MSSHPVAPERDSSVAVSEDDNPEQRLLIPQQSLAADEHQEETQFRASFRRFKEIMAKPTPRSMFITVLISGVVCGVVAWVFNSTLDALLHLTWVWVPQHIVMPAWRAAAARDSWFGSKEHEWVLSYYIVFICATFGLVSGASQSFCGAPGDLPDTIRSFHKLGYVPYSQAPSMFIVSLLSLAGGGSLGPEAPILTLSASSMALIYQNVLQVEPLMLRYSSLVAMAAGLAAFFGVGIGGALFALEVPHRMGIEYFEMITYAIAAGVACLSVFRGIVFEPFGAVWEFSSQLGRVDSRHVVLGLVIGFLAAIVATMWIHFTKWLKQAAHRVGLDEHHKPIICGVLGGLVIGVLGITLPPVLFWGEYEINTLADPSRPLPHVWPKGGFYGLEPFKQGEFFASTYATIGLVKLLAVSVTLIAGFRGGFIFPMLFAGTSLGYALRGMIPNALFSSTTYPPVLWAMTFAAGLTTSITRTPLSTTVILTVLCGQPDVSSPCLGASIVALMTTRVVPFIMSQQSRPDKLTVLSTSSYRIVHDYPEQQPADNANFMEQNVFNH